MATAVAPFAHAHTASLAIPVTQNTGRVLEFKCLFTNDIRRKQKRWQDGRLKFHAFNKRVRVFDDRSTLVGDTHFQEEYEFEEGEELTLDRGDVLVQVGECVAQSEQDLTELIDKRFQEKEKRREARVAAAAAASPLTAPARTSGALSFSSVTPAIGAFQARPKTLNQVLGTPSGHHGRAALPTRSPFEERRCNAQRSEKENIEERPAKRRRPEPAPSRAGYAQNLTGATLNLSTPTSTPGFRFEAIQPRPIIKHRYTESIDLTSDEIQPVDGTALATSNLTIESSGIRVTKAQHGGRVAEKRKPEKSGYAENLTGAALTLSGTYEKPRTVGAAKIRPNDALPKSSRTLQRLAAPEAVHPTLTKKANMPSREEDRFEKIGSVDRVTINARHRRTSDLTQDDTGFVEIRSSPADDSVINTNDNPSRSTSNKHQKMSQRKSKSTEKKVTSRLPPQPAIALKEQPYTSSLQKANDDTSKPIREEATVLAAKRVRPLRIKTGSSRCMLISAGRANSRSSVGSSKLRAAETIKTKHGLDQSHPSEAILPSVSRNLDTISPRQEANPQQSTLDVFDDYLCPQHVDLANFSIDNEPLEPLSPHTTTIVSTVPKELSRRPSPVEEERRMDPEGPPSSPGFEGLDWQTVDTLLSKNGNASPFAPKALRDAVEQAKSPLQPTRIRERPPNAAESNLAPNAELKLSRPSLVKENISTATASKVEHPRETLVVGQNEASWNENATAAFNKAIVQKNSKSPQDSLDIQPKIKESSSALDIPIPPPAILPQPTIPKSKDSKPTPSPYLINLNAIPSPPHQAIKEPDVLPPIIRKPDQQSRSNTTEDPAQHQPDDFILPPPPPLPKKPIIPNPATRGKKAAQKTDAAGMVPIIEPIFPHLIPPPPAPVPRQNISRHNVGRVHSTGSLNNAGGVGNVGRQRESNRTGGMVRAGDVAGDMGAGGDGKGPWGKEAFDLFDWRPPRLRV